MSSVSIFSGAGATLRSVQDLLMNLLRNHSWQVHWTMWDAKD